MTIKSIAAELGVADSQVRKWKKQDNWEGNSKGTLDKKKDVDVPFEKARGGQKGNQNAKGHGAPIGNKNNFKHGIYENIYWNALSDEEKQIIEGMSFADEENLLIEQIQLLTVREYRLMRRIEESINAKDGLSVESVINKKLRNDFDIRTEIITRTISVAEVIGKMECELTKVQSRKTRCIEALNRLRMQRKKLENDDRGNDIVNDWIAGLIGGDENE